MTATFANPFRPGAGHQPPFLAGRQEESNEFRRLLDQDVILKNLVLTGLRGVGKTVLLDAFRPVAIENRWLWVGADLSESTSLSEERLAVRLLTDLAAATSAIVLSSREVRGIGFHRQRSRMETRLTYPTLRWFFEQTPGLISDKLKAVLELAWKCLAKEGKRGVVFAYDEAQNMSDRAEQYPLSLLLEIFQSVQKKGAPLLLVLAGLPTLFPKLVEARTFAERMFHVAILDRLSERDSRDAILKPIERSRCPVRFQESMVRSILEDTGGYPYFIQFVCREVIDALLQRLAAGKSGGLVMVSEIVRKLDSDFYAGRWARVTDRQREMLTVIAHLENADGEFTIQEIVDESKARLTKPFSASHINQMLAALATAGLVYKNRHGRYAFALPLMGRFIMRQEEGA